ncbi:MAG TPA: RNA polymerase sigma factor [Polyangiaceae bacterium]
MVTSVLAATRISTPPFQPEAFLHLFALREEREGADAGTLGFVGDSDELVARCKAGDRTAFAQLFREQRASVTQLVQRMTGGSPDLEDLVQEVFVQVHKSLGSFRSQARLSTWIYRIAVNVVLMHRRARKSRPLVLAPPSEPAGADTGPAPDEQLARRRRIDAFYRVLDRVGDKKRTVYVLHDLQGLSPAEISTIVSAPVLTVRTRLFYARREVLAQLTTEPALAGLMEGIPISDPAPAAPEPHKEPA